jgi:CheY-like chemotaxis protein
MYDLRVSDDATLRVLIYSDDRDVRASVISALGTRPHPDLPPVEFTESATEPMVWKYLDGADKVGGAWDLAILDGESVPAGGMGIARQMRDELSHVPPVLVLTGRPQDAWLATWSKADAVVAHPIDPLRLGQVAVDLLRRRVAAGA